MNLRGLWTLGCVGLALAVASMSCSSEVPVPRERTGRTTSPLSDPVCNEGAHGTAVTPGWASRLAGLYSRHTQLDASLTNQLDVDAMVSARIRVTGIGGRVIERDVWTGTLASGTTLPLGLVLADLPLHTVIEAAQAELVVRITDPPEYLDVEIATQPLYYRAHDDSFGRFDLFGEAPPTNDHISSPATFGTAVSDLQVAANEVPGRTSIGEYYDNASSNWYDLELLPVVGDDYHVAERHLPISEADSAVLTSLFDFIPAPQIDDDYAPVHVCVAWPASFVDQTRGEDRWGPYTASFAEAWIQGPGELLPRWSGTLDAGGCTPALRLQNYTNYVVGLGTKLHHEVIGSSRTISVVHNGGPVYGVGVFSTLDVLRPPPSPDIYIRLSPNVFGGGTHYTRVAAVMSAALAVEGPRIPDGTYTVRADSTFCLACFVTSEDEVRIGPNNDGTHNSQYKFVVAHEFGHAVQHHGMGTPGGAYDPAVATDSGPCGCGFVADPADRAHCLQSRQGYGPTVAEGFAHYFASRVWNYDDPDACTFVYYKNFKEGGQILHPPLVRSCATPVRWLATQCPVTQRGVEWDWMNFQRRLAVMPNPTKLDDLLDVYRRGCGGTSCSGQQPSFSSVLAGAQAKYGALDPRTQNLGNAGAEYGVDY